MNFNGTLTKCNTFTWSSCLVGNKSELCLWTDWLHVGCRRVPTICWQLTLHLAVFYVSMTHSVISLNLEIDFFHDFLLHLFLHNFIIYLPLILFYPVYSWIFLQTDFSKFGRQQLRNSITSVYIYRLKIYAD